MDNKVELNDDEMIVPAEDKPKKTKVKKEKSVLTEDRLMEILEQQYFAMEELVKNLEDRISYRCFNGVKAELRRQLKDFMENGVPKNI